MKKILSVLAICMICLLAGCDMFNNGPKSTEEAVVGYKFTMAGGETSYTFNTDGTAVVYFPIDYHSGDSNYIYKIDGVKVEVCHDYTDAWVEEIQGTVITTFTYEAKRDVLIDEAGIVYKKY